jgi:hypothetical protein
MGSAKGDSWLSCAGGWLGSAGGTTGPPRSQSPIGQGCGHAVGDDAAAQSLDDHWCLRCVQLTTLGETLCPSCKNNLIVPFKSSFHIPPYLALRHFASAWRHARRRRSSRDDSGQRDTHRARSPGGSGSVGVRLGQRRSFGRRQFGRRRRQLRRWRWLRRRLGRRRSLLGCGSGGSGSGGRGDDGSRPAAVCGGSGSGGVRLERWCASGGSGGDVSASAAVFGRS